MHMHMVSQLLVPCMQDLDNPGCCAEIFFIGGQLQKCLGTAPVEHAVKKLLVAVNQCVQFMRQCKDHMEIGGINDFCAAFVRPDFLLYSLTVRAVAVTAGTVVEFHVSAVGADGNVDSEISGLAVKDGMRGFALDIGLWLSARAVFFVGILPYLLNFKVTHDMHLPFGQTG